MDDHLQRLSEQVGELRGTMTAIVSRQDRHERAGNEANAAIRATLENQDRKLDELVALWNQAQGAGWLVGKVTAVGGFWWGVLASGALAVTTLAVKNHWFGL